MHWLRCVRFPWERCHARELILLGETYLSWLSWFYRGGAASIRFLSIFFFFFSPRYLSRALVEYELVEFEENRALVHDFPSMGTNQFSATLNCPPSPHLSRNDFLLDVRYGTITRRSVTKASGEPFIPWRKVANLPRHSPPGGEAGLLKSRGSLLIRNKVLRLLIFIGLFRR